MIMDFVIYQVFNAIWALWTPEQGFWIFGIALSLWDLTLITPIRRSVAELRCSTPQLNQIRGWSLSIVFNDFLYVSMTF